MEKNYIEAFGAVDSKIDVRDYQIACASQAAVELPESFSLNIRRVKNQSEVGSCVAHALAAAVEYFNYMQEKSDVTMSTEFIYGNRINSAHTNHGMIVRDALENLRQYGTCPETNMPGNIEVPEAIERFNRQAIGVIPQAYPNRITNYCRLTSDYDMKLWLMTKGPVVFSVQWYQEYHLTVNEELYFHREGPKSGGHCMIIYGWNKYGWLFQNSWGTDWGDGGRAVYPYGEPIKEAWGVEDTCYSTYHDDLILQFKTQIAELSSALSEANDKIATEQVKITKLQSRIQELLDQDALTDEKQKWFESEQKQLLEKLSESQEEARKYTEQLQDAQKQIILLNETIVEIKKPYKNWPKWLVSVINFILNIVNKIKEGAKKG